MVKAKPKKPAPAKPASPASARKPTAKEAVVMMALLAVTNQPQPGPKETLKEFCYRLFLVMADVKDDDYNKLPADARAWYETSSELYNAEKFSDIVALPGMPGYDPAPASSEPAAAVPAKKDDADKPVETSKSPTPTEGAKVKKVTKGAAKPDKKATNGEAKERAPRTDSTAYQVRKTVVKNPDIDFEALCKKLDIKGKAASPTGHVHNMFQHAKHVMSIAKAEGLVK